MQTIAANPLMNRMKFRDQTIAIRAFGFVNPGVKIYVTAAKLADDMQLSRQTVRRALKSLVASRLLAAGFDELTGAKWYRVLPWDQDAGRVAGAGSNAGHGHEQHSSSTPIAAAPRSRERGRPGGGGVVERGVNLGGQRPNASRDGAHRRGNGTDG